MASRRIFSPSSMTQTDGAAVAIAAYDQHRRRDHAASTCEPLATAPPSARQAHGRPPRAPACAPRARRDGPTRSRRSRSPAPRCIRTARSAARRRPRLATARRGRPLAAVRPRGHDRPIDARSACCSLRRARGVRAGRRRSGATPRPTALGAARRPTLEAAGRRWPWTPHVRPGGPESSPLPGRSRGRSRLRGVRRDRARRRSRALRRRGPRHSRRSIAATGPRYAPNDE